MPMRTVTIAAGQSLSTSVGLGTDKITALIGPANWKSAPMSFQMSPDNINFYEVSHWSTDQVWAIPVVPNHWITMHTEDFPPNTFIKVRSGYPNAPIVQDAEQVIQIWCV